MDGFTASPEKALTYGGLSPGTSPVPATARTEQVTCLRSKCLSTRSGQGAEPERERFFGRRGLADLLPGEPHRQAGLPHITAFGPEGLVAAMTGRATRI